MTAERLRSSGGEVDASCRPAEAACESAKPPATRESVAAWIAHDLRHGLHRTDEEAVRATEAARALVLELFGRLSSDRDLFNACARLGVLIAEAGGSPSLAALTVDGAVAALVDANLPPDTARIASARASLVEGYVAQVRDAERAEAALAWEYPRCAGPLAEGSAAIACGYPSDDAEALAAWAARVAKGLVRAKVRRVTLTGDDRAKTEVAAAVTLVGIEVLGDGDATAGSPSSPRPRQRSWLRLPWSK